MRNIQTIWLDLADQPQVHISDLQAYDPNAQVEVEAHSPVRIAAGDPAALRALARAFDEAAVRLSATLDARAAREINAQAAPLPIDCQAGAVHLDWTSANACTATHTIQAGAA